jgi:hypothetical protein
MFDVPELECVSEDEIQEIAAHLIEGIGRRDFASWAISYVPSGTAAEAPSSVRFTRARIRGKRAPISESERRKRKREKLAAERRRHERRVEIDREQFLDDIWEFINRRPCTAVEVGQRFQIPPEEADWLMAVLVSQGRLKTI